MEFHVFAVWDFMCILKKLQNSFTCTSSLWIPPTDSQLAYFINSIVVGEESDDLIICGSQNFLSHFDLYIESMKDIDANTLPINNLINQIKNGASWKDAIRNTRNSYPFISNNTFEFVEHTLNTVDNATIFEIASCFLFGREDSIPKMFENLLANFQNKKLPVPNLITYLNRHIHVDGECHGPMAASMLSKMCINEEIEKIIVDAGRKAIEMRLHLWDGILEKI
jgi:hypothetical protein